MQKDSVLILLQDIVQVLKQYGLQYSVLINKIYQFLQKDNVSIENQYKDTVDKNLYNILQDNLHNKDKIQLKNNLIEKKINQHHQKQQQKTIQKFPKFLIIPQQSDINSLINHFFIYDYNFQQDIYQIITANQLIQQHQKILSYLNLLSSSSKSHIHQIKKTQSMTEILKLRINLPTIAKPIIIPNQINEQSYYAYFYSTSQCVQYKGQYFTYQKFYGFLSIAFVPETILQILKDILNKTLQFKMLQLGPQNIQYHCFTNVYHKIIFNQIAKICYKIKFPQIGLNKVTAIKNLEQKQIKKYCKLNKKRSIKIFNSIKDQIFVNMDILLVYAALTDCKIILIANKQNRYIISQVIISLINCLKPLKYAYPILQCSLTKDHQQFLSSPMPIMMGYWSSDRKLKKFMALFEPNFQNKFLKRQTNLIIIDLIRGKLINRQLTHEQSYITQSIEKYINKYKKNGTIYLKISSLLNTLLKKKQPYNDLPNQQWVTILRKKILSSQMYSGYCNKYCIPQK